MTTKKAPSLALRARALEATGGFEPPHKGFADPCLTAWLRRRVPWPLWDSCGMVAQGGIEPPTRGFSVPCSTD
jgi:hypothetical protein